MKFINEFKNILNELEFYHAYVEEHFNDFEETKSAWFKILNFLRNN